MPSAPDPVPVSDRSRALEHLGGALAEAGIPRMPARVWAALLSDDEGRMTAGDLAGALEVSPAAVSGAVRYLAGIGLIRRERAPGTRRDVYVAMDEVWHDMLLRADQTYRPIIRALQEAERAAGTGSAAAARLAVSRDFLEFIAREMEAMAQRWDEHRRSRAPETVE